MKKIAVAVFTKINDNTTLCIERAVYKAVFLHLSNYFEDAVYGTVIDLPDSPCYKSHGDREIIETVSRCYGALPRKYKESFFIVVRARRYNVNRTKSEAFCCENGAYGALNDIISGNNEWFFALGNVPSSYEYLYFSGSDGVIEAGGINALLRIAAITGKNVFPCIKNEPYSEYEPRYSVDVASGQKKLFFSEKRREGSLLKKEKMFSSSEGLYIRKKWRLEKVEKGSSAFNKRYGAVPKYGCIQLKSVYVLNIPRDIALLNSGGLYERKKSFSRFAYRAALAASRVFAKKTEKACISVVDDTEAAECLVALIAMRCFGFLGDAELIERSEILLDIIEEKTLYEDKKTDKGKVIFLINLASAAYTKTAFLNSLYWPIKLRASEVCLRLKRKIKTKDVNNGNVYHVMCCNEADLNINKRYALPKLVGMMLSEKESDMTFKALCFDDVEAALCVLAVASNVCFRGNIREFLLSDPVFRAKSSYLSRMTVGRSDLDIPKEVESVKVKTEALLSNKGLVPVRECLYERGADARVIPVIAYFQKIIRQIPINNNSIVVKVCYIVDRICPLLVDLVRTASAYSGICVCIIFSNFRAFSKAEKIFIGKANLFLSDDTEKCEAVKRSSVIVQSLTPETTLSELMTVARRYGRFKANVISKPELFSHSLYAGGGLKNGFCTFLQSGRNVSYGEFIKNPFTEVKSVATTFVPRLRAKLISVSLADEKYRSATRIFVLNEKGNALEVGDVAELSGKSGECDDKITVLSHVTDGCMLFAVQIYKNEKERTYLQAKLRETDFFECCAKAIGEENEIQSRQVGILRRFLCTELAEEKDFSNSELRAIMGRQVPRSFFSKMIFLAKAGELEGEKLPLAARAYAEQFSDRKIFDVCLPAAYTKNGEKISEDGKERKAEYRYPFYIHCLDRIKKSDRRFYEIKGR